MVSGNMVPSFPSSVAKLKFIKIPRMFTLRSVYSGTCRARPIAVNNFNVIIYYELLYVTRNGTNNVPTKNIKSAVPRVIKMLLNDERKLPYISIGKRVNETNVILPGIVILCSVPQLPHFIGL